RAANPFFGLASPAFCPFRGQVRGKNDVEWPSAAGLVWGRKSGAEVMEGSVATKPAPAVPAAPAAPPAERIGAPRELTFHPSDWAVLSRSWFPVARSDEIAEKPVRMRLLDVDVVVYRTNGVA